MGVGLPLALLSGIYGMPAVCLDFMELMCFLGGTQMQWDGARQAPGMVGLQAGTRMMPGRDSMGGGSLVLQKGWVGCAHITEGS